MADQRRPGRQWWALSVIAIAQLMILLDIGVVNVALASIQRDLHLSASSRQWVITAYTLPFGGFLLLGGRLADYTGRRRAMVISLVGFGIASALGGLAWEPWVLYLARALQGVFGAVMAPTVLALVTIGYHGRDRRIALGVLSGAQALGLAGGLVLGGMLTQYLSWRWCLLVNIPISLPAAYLLRGLVPESRAGATASYDASGAIAGTLGLVVLVFGVSRVPEDGWGSMLAIGCFIIAVALLAAFVVIEHRADHPLLPLGLLAAPARQGILVAFLLFFGFGVAQLALLTTDVQQVLGQSPVQAGLSFMPFTLGAGIGAGLSVILMRQLPWTVLVAVGCVIGAVGMFIVSGIGTTSHFFDNIFPGTIVFGFGTGLLLGPGLAVVITNTKQDDAGVLGGLVNASQQVGISIGLALLNTVATSSTNRYLRDHGLAAAKRALVNGFVDAFTLTAVAMLAAALIVLASTLVARHRGREARSFGADMPAPHSVASSSTATTQTSGTTRQS